LLFTCCSTWNLNEPFSIRQIEDVIRITETSYEIITTAPKEIPDIEAWMAGGK